MRMSVLIYSPHNEASPLEFRFLCDARTANGYKEGFSEGDVEVHDDEELPGRD